jgi:hypothetical protein
VNTPPEPEAPSQSQTSSPAQNNGVESGPQGAAEKQPAQASARGGQIANESDRAQGGQVADERVGKTGKDGGRHSHAEMNTNDNQGGQIAPVIPQSSAHPNSSARVGDTLTPENPAPDDVIAHHQLMDGQAASWLKSLLPEPQNGWWEVNVKGRGFAVKFRWRDTDRQTLLFPQITVEQLIALKQSDSEEAARTLRERISANLHNFLLNPARRDKALAVAAKLSIDLPYPPYTSNEQEDMGSD